ncbi:MAG: hypothetical protein J7K88_09130 [Candidatus Fermentibacteraceae bacterium]|nr:hypothetical protein [Candidatus Fermentibacteraceae bacterium]
MNWRAEVLMLPVLVVAACGGGGNLDSDGLASSDSALEQFTRASQLYYRGRLTAALDEFNGVVYRYPESPLASDARLAVRRLESDLSGEEQQSSAVVELVVDARIAVVGRSAVNSSIISVGTAVSTLGAAVTEITDDQAPPLTVVFYTAGYEDDASTVADSLGRWLSHPESIGCRQGDELIGTVAAGYDVLVIVGSDAVFASIPGQGSL